MFQEAGTGDKNHFSAFSVAAGYVIEWPRTLANGVSECWRGLEALMMSKTGISRIVSASAMRER